MSTPFESARDAWNYGADAYVEFIESGSDYYRLLVHGPGLLTACGDVRGLRVLDIGCGHGYFSRELARAGASVFGVDLSDKLVERASEIERDAPLGIEYRVLDAARIGIELDAESFDLAVGCMSLQDVDALAPTLAGAVRVLKPGARLVFSVPHPCVDTPVREWARDESGRKLALHLDRYFSTGPAVCDWSMSRLAYRWRTPFRRHTLTEWSALLNGAGLTLRAWSEPRPDRAMVREHPELEDCSRMPYFLVFDTVRA